MTTATQTRTLKIDGMTGDTCVKKVTGALNDVKDLTTESVKVGSAVINSDKTGCDAACTGIKKAGFNAREDMNATAKSEGEMKDGCASHCATKPQTDAKNSNAAPLPLPNPAMDKMNAPKPTGTNTNYAGQPAKPAVATK